MSKIMFYQPFYQTSTSKPKLLTWDGVTMSQIGDDVNDPLNTNNPINEAGTAGGDSTFSGGLRACWFGEKIYVIQNKDVFSWNGTAWAHERSVGTAAIGSENWNGAVWVVLNVSGTPRLYALVEGTAETTWSAAYKDLGGSWTTVGQNVGIPSASDLGYGFNPRIIRDQLWFSGDGNRQWFFDPASGSMSVILGFGNPATGTRSMLCPTAWRDDVYFMGFSATTQYALYKAADIPHHVVALGSATTNSVSQKWGNDGQAVTFVDPASNKLICFARGYDTSSTVNSTVQVFSISTSNVVADITSAVLPATLLGELIDRRAERWTAFVDNAENTGTATRTPAVHLYQNNNSSLFGAWSHYRWNGVAAKMTGGSVATAGTFTGGMGADGGRMYNVQQCNPVITNLSPGNAKMTLSVKLYLLAGSANTTGWKVRLYFRKEGENYASHQATLANANQGGALTITSNEIQAVAASATAPVVLTFDWTVGGGGDPADGSKIGLVVYATR